MEEIYTYCDQTRLPICWHVNITKYLAEFDRVMQRHPNMVVIVPHFGVTFFQPRQQPFKDFQRLLDTYPNLYTDTSFGTRNILVSGLEAVSADVETFRAFFNKYSDRILFGTDMVITGNKEKSAEWIEAVIRACRDVLEKDSFHFYMGAKGSAYADPKANNTYGAYRGLNLPDDILRKIYETNINKILPPQP
jgi:predicted TIM-barrel fold metal-dependent hydrolase